MAKEWEINVSFFVEADTREKAVQKVEDDIKGNEDHKIFEVRERGT